LNSGNNFFKTSVVILCLKIPEKKSISFLLLFLSQQQFFHSILWRWLLPTLLHSYFQTAHLAAYYNLKITVQHLIKASVTTSFAYVF